MCTEGRDAFGRHDWPEAYRALSRESARGDLAPDDLERLAVAAYLLGRDADSTSAWTEAHRGHLVAGNPDGAARCLSWLGVTLLLGGAPAQASGWLARGARIAGPLPDSPSRGYLLVPVFLAARDALDVTSALDVSAKICAVSEQVGDPDLSALGLLCRGQALVLAGDPAKGLRALDEAMVGLASGEVSPVPTGLVYCAVIETCMSAHDVRRAAEWTDVLSDWCADQPGLVPYRGQCLVYRSEILQRHGDWTGAEAAAELAERLLDDPPHPARGQAHYRRAELHRLGASCTRPRRHIHGQAGGDAHPSRAWRCSGSEPATRSRLPPWSAGHWRRRGTRPAGLPSSPPPWRSCATAATWPRHVKPATNWSPQALRTDAGARSARRSLPSIGPGACLESVSSSSWPRSVAVPLTDSARANARPTAPFIGASLAGDAGDGSCGSQPDGFLARNMSVRCRTRRR